MHIMAFWLSNLPWRVTANIATVETEQFGGYMYNTANKIIIYPLVYCHTVTIGLSYPNHYQSQFNFPLSTMLVIAKPTKCYLR